MSYNPIRLNRLSLLGPDKEPAKLTFSAGLNVVRGASDTGKSFVVASIDYMLGARNPLKKITESDGYNRLVLSIYSPSRNAHYTLVRGTQGGDFELFLGDFDERPAGDPEQVLKVSPQSTPNISHFLLDLVDLPDKKVMKNKDGDTERLGFRNLVHLCLVNETQIQSETPPALSEQVVQQTKSKQVFKLLLTGVDDSGIVSRRGAKASKAKSDAQIELIDELIAELQETINQDGRQQEQLADQLQRLDTSTADLRDAIGITEDAFGRMRQRRLDLRQMSDANDSRQGEIGSLKSRLQFLDEHYVSDLRRLEAILEAGAIYDASQTADCPYCGADAEHQKLHAKGEEEARFAAAAAQAEIGKIRVLRSELQQTVEALDAELVQLRGELPLLRDELSDIDVKLKERLPQLQEERGRYSELLELRASLNVALEQYAQMTKLLERKVGLAPPEEDEDAPASSNLIDPGLSEQTLYSFSRTVEGVLRDWNHPEPRAVSVREKDLELIVGGKPRASSGKGVRALLHTSFTLGLLQHARTMNLSHLGFVVLDSPLLTYAPPEKNEKKSDDDEAMAQTNLKEEFFESLRSLPENMQVLIVENVPVPQWVLERASTEVFTGAADNGRYGFIPRPKTPQQ